MHEFKQLTTQSFLWKNASAFAIRCVQISAVSAGPPRAACVVKCQTWYQGKRLLACVKTDLAWFLNISVHISRCSCMFFTGIMSYSHCVFGSCFFFFNVWIQKLKWFNHTIFYCLILLLTVARLYCSAVFVTDWKLMHYNMLHAYAHI